MSATCAYLRLLFAYTGLVWNLPQTRLCENAVKCKGCAETIPAPVGTMPDTWIVATCPLCGERRRYLPTDMFRGASCRFGWSLRVFDPDAGMPRLNRSLVYLGACIIAGQRLARERQVNVRVVPTRAARRPSTSHPQATWMEAGSRTVILWA